MSLFDTNKILNSLKIEKPKTALNTSLIVDSKILVFKGDKDFVSMMEPMLDSKSLDDLRSLCISFKTLGNFSLHNMIAFFALYLKSSSLVLSSWSISQNSVMRLIDLKSKGFLTKIDALVDMRSIDRHVNAYHLCTGNFDTIGRTHCHAKVAVLYSDDLSITINSSCNLTENPRIEAGTILFCPKVALMHKDWILKELENAK